MRNDDTSQDGALHEVARRLGSSAAVRLDVERTAAAVVQRLRARPARVPWLSIAAAVAILLGGTLVARLAFTGGGEARAAAVSLVADDLRDLTADELREVLAVVDDTTDLGLPAPRDAAGFEELDAQQLRTLLRTLEG